MKAVLQRVSQGSVKVDGLITGQIGTGLVILLGVEQGDSEQDGSYLAQKAAELRIFSDETGKMNLSVKDVNGGALVISQFTLMADWRKGRRPGFTRAAHPVEGERLYHHFASELKKLDIPVEMGVFGAHMEVSLVNDGPVTLLLENQFGKGGSVE